MKVANHKSKILMKGFGAVLFVMVTSSICMAGDTLQINTNQYFIDHDKQLVITNLDVEIANAQWSGTKTHIALDNLYALVEPINTITVGVQYAILESATGTAYNFYFTQLPIISITTEHEIVDEPEVLAHFTMIESNQNFLESAIGIQYRGGWSQTLPKKSMAIEFWTDDTGTETQNHSLLGMINDDDWNLQAMYNEPLRIRSKTNNDLWRMINTLHYQSLEPLAINGVRMKYVELFVNNSYRGIYCLGEKVNRKQLRLKQHNGNIRGELYKGVTWGATTYSSAPAYSNSSLLWSGFEYKHPKEEINWAKLHEFVDFVVNSPAEVFYSVHQYRFDTDNLVDYFIFLNLLRATDNTGKNVYVAKYNTNNKYFYVPWDLDGTFGTIWNGEVEDITDDLLSNGFYNRLWHDCDQAGFRNKLLAKWQLLRTGVITTESLLELFTTSYDLLLQNGVYERESIAWPDYNLDPEGIEYMAQWMTGRIAFLDGKFAEPCIPLSTRDDVKRAEWIEIYPNPTNDVVHLKSKIPIEYSVIVYNTSGQKVMQEHVNFGSSSLSLKALSPGMYFIRISVNNTVYTHKIIRSE